MKYTLLLFVVIAGAQASAYSIAYNGGLSTMNAPYSLGSTSNIQYKKVVIQAAKDDAATFVSSDGKTRGAFFEQAVILLRADGYTDTDAELAQRIVAEQF